MPVANARDDDKQLALLHRTFESYAQLGGFYLTVKCERLTDKPKWDD